MAEENPFTDSSDEQELDATCWMSGDRLCGPDCMAYDDRFEGDDRFSACMFINLGRQTAKSLSELAIALRPKKQHPTPPQTPPPKVML